MNKVLLIIIALLASFISAAGIVINGEVVDAISRQALEAASVAEVDNSATKTFTDRYGNFSIRANREGKINLVVSCIGYKADTVLVYTKEEARIELQPDIV